MFTRRATLTTGAASLLLPARSFAQPSSDFDALLASTLAGDPDLLTRGSQEREAAEVTQIASGGRGPRPRYGKPTREISDRAKRLIIACEVSSSSQYKKKYQHPVWPGGRSGVTIGVGYDLGYVTAPEMRQEWGGRISPEMIAALAPTCDHLRGAERLSNKLHDLVSVPWNVALSQFEETTLPLYVSQTLDSNYLPGIDKLKSSDCLGALVSLVFNRGPSFKLGSGKDRYMEMRAIRLHIVRGDFDLVPAELRSMARLWKGRKDAAGLVTRRELEARLFQSGLKKA